MDDQITSYPRRPDCSHDEEAYEPVDFRKAPGGLPAWVWALLALAVSILLLLLWGFGGLVAYELFTRGL